MVLARLLAWSGGIKTQSDGTMNAPTVERPANFTDQRFTDLQAAIDAVLRAENLKVAKAVVTAALPIESRKSS